MMDSEQEDQRSSTESPSGPVVTEPPPEVRHLVPLAVAFEGGLALLALGLGWLCNYWPLETFPTSADRISDGVWIGGLATLPMLLGLVLINRYPLGPLADLKQVVDEMLVPLFRNVSLAGLVIIAVMAGVGEEMLFRGLLQGGLADALRDRMGQQAAAWTALAAASVVFGLMHPITKLYALLCVLVGFYLGWLWIITDNLLVPMVAHALYDFAALIYLLHSAGKPASNVEQ
jgi:membrane protease YdiL (CAAX protease family)